MFNKVRFVVFVVSVTMLLSSCGMFGQGAKTKRSSNLIGSDGTSGVIQNECPEANTLPIGCSCEEESGSIVYTCPDCQSMSYDETYCECDNGEITCNYGNIGTDDTVVVNPQFSPVGGSYNAAQTVSISTSTTGASIHYTIGSSTPTCSSTIYTSPLAVSTTKTIRAIACKTGMTNSGVATASYNMNLSAAAIPAFNPAPNTYSSGQNVAISTVTSGATIKYTTDGSVPSCSVGTTYSSAIWVPSTMTIKAIACKTGMSNSSVTTGTYTINLSSVAAPAFSPTPGTFNTTENVNVSISSGTSGASIYYKIDGSNPDCAVGTLYSGYIPLAATTTIKAIACKSGFNKSSISTGTYTIVDQATCSGSCTSPGTEHPSATCTPATCGTQTSTRSCICQNRPTVWACECDTYYGPH